MYSFFVLENVAESLVGYCILNNLNESVHTSSLNMYLL